MLRLLLLSLTLAQAPDTTCAARVRPSTDSLRAETYRSQGVRKTVVRRLATRIDSTTGRCLTSVPPVDTVAPPPVDTVPPPPVDTVTPPPPVDTTTPPPPPPPPPASGGFVGPAELPRAVPSWPAALATASCTATITANLQAAVTAAKPGDVLCLSGVFRGTVTLPARGDSGWVVLRSLVSPVTPGARVRPSHAPQLALLIASGTSPAIVAAPNARGWYLREIEVTTDSALTTLTYSLVDLNAGPTANDFPRDLVFDRAYLHGWPHRPLRRCVTLNSAATAIINSWLDECHEKGSDSQAIAGWAGPGPYLIENNTLAGAGENVMFGGADPKFVGVHPSDITLRRNHVVTPLSWKGVWTKKNLLETKNARRILIEQNVFDGSWGDGQTGYALMLKSANQSGATIHRDQGTRDLIVRRNLIIHASASLNLNGQGGDLKAIDSVTRRVAIIENWSDSLGGAYGLDPRGVAFYSNAQDVLVQRNVWLSPTGQGSAFTVGNATEGQAVRLTIDGDIRTRGAYGMMGCWSCAAPPASLRLVLLGAPQTTLPGVAFAPDLAAAIALGYGVSRATIDAAVRGVVVQP